MNTQTQDLETRAKVALDMVKRHGVTGSPVDRDALQDGLENGVFDQSAVDGAEKQYHQFRAQVALDMVK